MDGPYDFSDALRLAKAGYGVRRSGWSSGYVAGLLEGAFEARDAAGRRLVLLPEDLMAEDWTVVSGPEAPSAEPAGRGTVIPFNGQEKRRSVRRDRDREILAALKEIHTGYVELGHPCGNPGCGELACGWTRMLARLLGLPQGGDK